jgi:acetyl/propionyl-CoA carboxylase alpha subunit
MGDAAVAMARAAGYRNAGTVEFLLEGTGDSARFYFLEMNTRLQVEHPVTEQVTGVDLVRAQIAIAAGRPLPWTQEQISQRGHAIEVRVYAEDPARGDLPQAGPLLLYREPAGPGVRVDSGVAEGGEISVYYDPMIAKVIASGDSREAARRRAVQALRHFPVLGIRTNIPMLIALLEHPRVVSGAVHTGFLDAEGGTIRASLELDVPAAVLAVADAAREAGLERAAIAQSTPDPWETLADWRST